MVSKAEIEKDLGNEAYKKKEFSTALQHYNKAIDFDSSQIVYYNNKAAVLLQQNMLDECIIVCLDGIDAGRSNKADPKLIAKAYNRIGNAYRKKNNHKEALKYYKKSLAEYKEESVEKSRLEMEKLLEPSVKNDKEMGDDHYKKGDYVLAIKYYTDAMKTAPNDHVLFSNRAQCFYKLEQHRLAVNDCDECIKFDPKYAKGYLRKGYACFAMNEFSRAVMAFEKALKIDPNSKDCKDAMDVYKLALSKFYETPAEIRKRALEDPEIRDILSEPEMRLALEEIMKNPIKIAQYCNKSDDFNSKFKKLMDAGVLRFC